MEFLTWLLFFGGLAAEGALIALIIRAIERYKERRRNVYYIFRDGITKAVTYRQYRNIESKDDNSVYPDVMNKTEYRFKK